MNVFRVRHILTGHVDSEHVTAREAWYRAYSQARADYVAYRRLAPSLYTVDTVDYVTGHLQRARLVFPKPSV
jgi:hypothetical protein